MNLDSITNMFYFQMIVFKYDFDKIMIHLSKNDNYLFFLEDVNKLLDMNSDIFLFDIESLRKIKLIIESLSFKYHSVNYIKNYQKELYHRICTLERYILSLSEKYKNEAIEKLKKERYLPPNLDLKSDYLVTLYANDLDNYVTLLYQSEDYNEVDFISLFSTVNKMYSLNNDIFNDSKLKVGLMVALIKCKILYKDNSEVLEYANLTEKRVTKQLEKDNVKIISFREYTIMKK